MSAKRKFKTEQDILDTLKVVIDKGEWKGVKHLQKNNNSLHNAIYKGMGYTKAFSRLDLNYEDYKGANRKWTEEKILRELKKWVAAGRWEGTGHLHKNYQNLYDAIYNHLGFKEAFSKLGLEYGDYLAADHSLSENQTIEELKKWIDTNGWNGLTYLRNHHTLLYKGIKEIGVEKTFTLVGLDYQYYDNTLKWTDQKIAEDLNRYISANGWGGTYKLREDEPLLYKALYSKLDLEKAFQLIGLNYEEYRVNEQWHKEKMLTELKDWIESGKWSGTGHFMKFNKKLYSSIYKYIGMEEAFKILGLSYKDFVIQEGYPRERIERETLLELKKLMESNKWRGVDHLRTANYFLYISLNRLGFEEAFNRLGLKYEDYKLIKEDKVKTDASRSINSKWTEKAILSGLKKWIDEGKWKGQSDLSKNNSALYNAIRRNMGMKEAFSLIGLQYYDYMKKRGSKWTEEKMLSELEEWIEKGKWQGSGHFQKNSNGLYAAINRSMGLEKAFAKLSLNYNDYKGS